MNNTGIAILISAIILGLLIVAAIFWYLRREVNKGSPLYEIRRKCLMGGNVSSLPQNAQPSYFCLTFRVYDKIKILDADPYVLQLIRNVITQTWLAGIQNERNDNNVIEIKLRGTPFSKNSSKEEAISSKRMCCALLAELYQQGWELSVSSDLTRTQDLTSWFFQRIPEQFRQQSLTTRHIFCLSLSGWDKFQLVNAQQYFNNVLKDAVTKAYIYGIQDEAVLGNDYELKLRGNPWNTANLEEGLVIRRTLLQVIRAFDAQKYTLHGTGNLKGTADCLFFRHNESVVPGETRYCMLSLNASDRIRLVDATPELLAVVRQCVQQSWPRGLQSETDLSQLCSHEFKLNGYPWNSSGSDAVASRYLITIVLQCALANGWAVLTSLDISRRPNDKAVFVLKSCAPSNLAHFCISPNDTDKIRIINASAELQGTLATMIRSKWPYGINREGQLLQQSIYELKLNGQPWSAYAGNDYAWGRHLMTLLLEFLNNSGYRVICSADVSAKYIHQDNGPDYPIDVHSWFIAQTGVAGGASVAPSAPPAAYPSPIDPPPPSYEQAIK